MSGYELPTSIHLSGSKPKASLSKSPLTVMKACRWGGGCIEHVRMEGKVGHMINILQYYKKKIKKYIIICNN